MAAKNLPNLGLRAGFAYLEDGWGDDMNENMFKLSLLLNCKVKQKVSSTPLSPDDGDIYLFDHTHPTEPNRIAVYSEAVWKYYDPFYGWSVYNNATDHQELYSGYTWASIQKPNYGVKANIENVFIPDDVSTIKLVGDEVAGDGGAAEYKRVVNPLDGAFQTADGSYWVIYFSFNELNLSARLGEAEASITNETNVRITQYESLASQYTALYSRMGTAEADIVQERLVRTSLTDALASQYNALTASVGDNSAAIITEQTARANADSALASQITTLSATVSGNTAAITTEQTARANGDSALASQITTLSATVSGNTAAITTEQTARANGDSALASQITTLSATVSGNTAAITTEQTARANGDSALANTITALTSTVNGNTAAITTEQTARANGDSALANTITALTSTVNGNTAAISSEATTRANADSAMATNITTLQSRLNNVNGSGQTLEARVTSLNQAITDEASARASAITSVQSDYNSQISSVTTTLSSTTSRVGNVENQWTVKLNANGKVAGLSLINGSSTTSQFGITADSFYIFDSSGSGTSPFYVTGGQTYIQNATIANLSIGTRKIGNDQITQIFQAHNGSGFSSANYVYDPISDTTTANHWTVISYSVTMDYDGDILLISTMKQNYSSTARAWGAQLKVGSTVIGQSSGGSAISDSVAISGKTSVSAGTYTVYLLWYAADSTVSINTGGASLVAFRRYK